MLRGAGYMGVGETSEGSENRDCEKRNVTVNYVFIPADNSL